ncbi:MAG: phosphocarrier protein HPr [Betaproteobacteria bacterium TMED156]|nr:MAG: phosphocarrier protein HPr [Betaproteobacteria bacterium TMED156]
MRKSKIIITNKLGLHLRASSKLAQLASKFPCQVYICRNEKKVNAKSVLGITMLAAGKGCEVEIECNGEKEDLAITELLKLFQLNFYEEG